MGKIECAHSLLHTCQPQYSSNLTFTSSASKSTQSGRSGDASAALKAQFQGVQKELLAIHTEAAAAVRLAESLSTCAVEGSAIENSTPATAVPRVQFWEFEADIPNTRRGEFVYWRVCNMNEALVL